MKDGGPAFPAMADWAPDGMQIKGGDGMSLRAYIATAALQGMMARDSYDKGQATPQQRASLACIEADALIAELEKP